MTPLRGACSCTAVIAEFLEIDSGNVVLQQVVGIDPVPAKEASRLGGEAAEALAEWLDWTVRR